MAESNKANADPLEPVIIELMTRNELYEIKIKSKVSTQNISVVIDSLIDQISKSKSFSPKTLRIITEKKTETPQPRVTAEGDNPVRVFADKIGIDPDKFQSSNLVAVKNDSVQLLKPTVLEPSRSCLLLLAISEFVLSRPHLSYDEWKDLCETSKIKSNTPFHKIVNNVKSAGYINAKKYDNSKEILLEPKGVEIVKKTLEKYLSEL